MVRKRWPHYQVRILRQKEEEKQIFVCFQPQLGSRSGWQICEESSIHMHTWDIDAKSAAYRTARWLAPNTWRGFKARELRLQRELREVPGSIRGRIQEAEIRQGGTSAQPMTREQQLTRLIRLIQREWEKYKIYATSPPGEWMQYTTYEGASTEGRMEATHTTFQQ